MLNIYRRHGEDCGPKDENGRGTNCGKRSIKGHNKGFCPSKPPCWIYYEGIDGDGRYHKRQNLCDPVNGKKIRDWNRACEIIRDMDRPKPVVLVAQERTTLQEAMDDYRGLKAKRSAAVRGKTDRLLSRLQSFLKTQYDVITVDQVTTKHLIAYRNTWTDAHSTQRNNQTILKSFFTYCVDSDLVGRSPAKLLDPIPEDRVNVDPFTPDEELLIFNALPDLEDEYGRRGGPIAKQTKAFVYVMRYTGMSIGDTTGLPKADVNRGRVLTHRTKTGEEVYGKVPEFVIDALNESPHDSQRYFFWSGEGTIHSRTNKWGGRLQRLFVLANVRVAEVQKKRRSGGVLKDEPEVVKVSTATPHMFRHSLARDLIAKGMPMAELAKLLGNSLKTIEKFYGKWEAERQAKLDQHLETWWEDDPLTKMLKLN